MANVRREQILDAVERCILDQGIEGVTFARVSRIAGVRPSIVPHYFGSKGALMAAMVDRVLGRVEGLIDDAVAGSEGRALIDRLLDALFGGRFAVPSVILVLDQLRATAYFNEATRERLVNMYRHLERLAHDALADAYPEASSSQRQVVAYAVLCLGDANNSLRGVGFPKRYDTRARCAVEALLRHLDSDDSEAVSA
jgi:AcrR family transcriptional regulator